MTGRNVTGGLVSSPQFCVRLARGLVTHFNDEPIMTWEQAEDLRQKILDATGEHGSIEEVIGAWSVP